MDLNEIKSNHKPLCLFCGLLITEEIDSGWEGFTEDGKTTQPICVFCHAESDKPVLLKTDSFQ